jgi:hypothetical protein
MARARKAAESTPDEPEQTEPEQTEQEQREAAREAAGQANQDQQGAPVVEQTPQPDTTHFIAQPDILNAPQADESSDERREGSSGE